MPLYEVKADYHRERPYTSRHTQFSEEMAARMVTVHEENRDKRGEPVAAISVIPLDVDPTRLVLVVGDGEQVTRCPSYYAADSETLALEPGEYPLSPSTVDGRAADWSDPYYLNAAVPARRIDGRLYSGFGGCNFASRELPCEPVTYYWSVYAYHLGGLLESGKVRLEKTEK
jgi:hypothetical protein